MVLTLLTALVRLCKGDSIAPGGLQHPKRKLVTERLRNTAVKAGTLLLSRATCMLSNWTYEPPLVNVPPFKLRFVQGLKKILYQA